MEDRKQRDTEKQVSPIYPWDHMHRIAREAEEQPQKLLPLHEAPIRRNNQSMRVNKPSTGMTQRDGMGREEGGGFRMGNTCIPVVDSF